MDVLTILAAPQIQNIVVLIGIDIVVGILAALKNKEFVLGKLGGFMKKGIVAYVLGLGILMVVAEALPSLSLVVTVAYFLVILALIGSILDNLGKLGLPV